MIIILRTPGMCSVTSPENQSSTFSKINGNYANFAGTKHSKINKLLWD